jgi:tetratricopeptide (TPR) repeat protein
MIRSLRPWALPTLAALAAGTPPATAQTASVSEEVRTLQTYPFSEPNPVPVLARDPRLYPYHTFEGYAATAEPREWTVVRLENEWIEVFVLPEVGGKVWGAVVKETGHEFIYRNEVMKFRNIALRGPWTSGGIEFNFGVIGHTPATATPVDYVLRENADGSVSCVVGGMDLPSRTHWRVEIRLPADRAYFETNVLWYNPTPLEQPYYNWMTAAAFARNDLEMAIPGNAYLTHPGEARSWPVDDRGRYLPLYRNNTFGGHKSYHVVGELNDFFGGYYLEDDYGFGHWARYEDMPGQKLWLWALSREGGIWEDLLTDTDGQYVEFQAGRLFVQYSPGADVNPITQAGFDPLSASRWTETWFPLEGTGGLTDASRDGALHVERDGPTLTVTVNAFKAVTGTLEVWAGGTLVKTEPIALRPLERHASTTTIGDRERFRVRIQELDLDYDSDPAGRLLARPFATDPDAAVRTPEADQMIFQARELSKARRYAEARVLFEAASEIEPWSRETLLGLAELDYRAGLYRDALGRVNRALQLDAYDAEGNFLAGTIYRALNRPADARDALGWAARSTAHRSAAYAQLAELMVGAGDLDEAVRYARLAIDYDRHSVPGWRSLAVAGRLSGDGALAREARAELLELDPLHHFVRAEGFLGAPERASALALTDALGGEYPQQTLLELALHYVGLGLREDARALLDLTDGPAAEPVIRAWNALLSGDAGFVQEPGDLDFAFPYRRETLGVLQWATERSAHWGWRYLLALNLWAVDRPDEAASLLHDLGDRPDLAAFYVARAFLAHRVGGREPIADLRRAVALEPGTRVLHVYLARQLQDLERWAESLTALEVARSRFPEDFNLALLQARTLVRLDRADEATALLATIEVLPSEHARESHRIYEQAHTLVAMGALEAGDAARAAAHLGAALEWPEHLGQGRPYEPEERLVRYLLGRAEAVRGDAEKAAVAFSDVVDATPGVTERELGREAAAADPDPQRPPRGVGASRLDILAVAALGALGRIDALESVARAGDVPTGQDPTRLFALGEAGRFATALARALLDGTDASSAAVALATEFPLLFTDFEGELILRALTGR